MAITITRRSAKRGDPILQGGVMFSFVHPSKPSPASPQPRTAEGSTKVSGKPAPSTCSEKNSPEEMTTIDSRKEDIMVDLRKSFKTGGVTHRGLAKPGHPIFSDGPMIAGIPLTEGLSPKKATPDEKVAGPKSKSKIKAKG